jgi:toxin YoeB
MFQIEYDKRTRKQFKVLKNNKKLLAKIEQILENISTDPYSPEFKFERLKHDLSGFCSKRVDDKNRILYFVKGDKVIVIIISVMGHYDD